MSIAAAIYDGGLARANALTLEQERQDRARQLADFENLLDSIESQNLRTQGRVPESVVDEIVAVAQTLSVPAPPAVLAARSGPRLHDALLSWQGMLLDALRPHRLGYSDRFD
jgi:hypothetical protein